MAVLGDKAVVAALLKARVALIGEKSPNSLEASTVLSTLSMLGVIGHIDLDASHLKRIFEDGTSLLVRTLIKGTQIADLPNTSTPCKLERNTLNNRITGLNIVLTPSTMINKEVKVSTISSHPDRPRWSNMPSVLYAAPTRRTSRSPGQLVTSKPLFGNVLSFGSNLGFTTDFLEKMNADEHSHAQLIDHFRAQPAISKNLKEAAPFNTLPQSLTELKNQIACYHKKQTTLQEQGLQNSLYKDGSVPHNEVISRIWIWDALAVDVGKDVSLGLSTAVELQIARKALCTELDQLGTKHPMFEDFVKQQLSLDIDNKALSKAETLAHYDALAPDALDDILKELTTRLSSPVCLCRYSPQGPKIESLAAKEVSGAAVLDAVDSVLSSRMSKSTDPG